MIGCGLSKRIHVSRSKICERVKNRRACGTIACCAQDVEHTWSQKGMMKRLWCCHFADLVAADN
jgi:hypothetical protein